MPRLKRDHGTSQFYEGDSKINVFGDILALGLGYSMSKVCTLHGLWWFPVLWLVVSEVASALTFHDNLVLASVQTVWPQQWIKDYQQQLVPPHLSGLMRAGYWDNKVTTGILETKALCGVKPDFARGKDLTNEPHTFLDTQKEKN